MISLTLQQLAAAVDGRLIGSNLTIDRVTTDTRKVEAGALFIALQGERFDAHDFVGDAIGAGAAALLVSKHLQVAVPQVVVADTRIALGRLAGWVRQQSSARVVALTGSSGKTSVKEMTAAILRCCGDTLYTAGNLNNDIGVPLTLLRLTQQHRYAVIELGANHQGEIAYTTQLVRPESALVNNLAAAHLEGFGSLAGVARAKGEIFSGLSATGTAIFNADSHDWHNWQRDLQVSRVWRFSATQDADSEFYASDLRISAGGTAFMLHTPEGDMAIQLPLPGRHNIANALAAAALALSVGAPLTAIQQGLKTLQAVPGRLFPIVLSDSKLLLDDSYNANVGSMMAAVQTLADMPGYRVMIVGDMAELGEEAESCHRQVGEAARRAGIDKVLSTGQLSHFITQASGVGEHFTDRLTLAVRALALLHANPQVTLLVKGSRSAAMEQVVHYIQENGSC
ncbi:UDP-N-acetylmuramoyl-tripeptide--D-alanyl-D-alanine ligase [Erwinia sp. OLTSP20]|uniref:UDP-N-acetylmuramoyl-tripeptide--D-alanyl-D- alanine ligase n=1 Tax=unclassified Erwinia TaxID=2622719 RepID=UPI000C19328F|nr:MULTISPECIES: UDP-N-acetylmuramoyl-tripeptide--D-alanyl-D-alanine ligase [unclassified Erwinia]PIJ49747.1 UDP-N-acetylmuramoyl-tripeptide--D-alanyl-D-alanine ligase [Erwinia sp. OAMSP11]PIJ70845.1 UDP-N-acetylmuramoyl-tripeptide--D-alanyl-D-alanine ligase [Erwinia sp. OLSSP12]PIJ80211.1 UDP-N-acetylmuramoyl-tripeptide--D-alanyl-D-alanine ligase [Erwinia sp. OLCASP19]PIJ82334.1 UDP-N-acetylmuramoyl-tripeptide--D-alanyl-D-alanine ligase [Erwinia sp. OLMTSP26]PIJ85021.1 UDP-N-acetylmuramoyl-tr